MGICLGFELLHVLVANESRHDLLIKTDAEVRKEIFPVKLLVPYIILYYIIP